MRETFLFDGRRLPLVLVPGSEEEQRLDSLTGWIAENQQRVRSKIGSAGAVLLRGFRVESAADFQAVLRALGAELRDYTGGHSPRKTVAERVYTSTEYPASETIVLHNELAFQKRPPRFLYFYCEVPPEEQGETPIVDCRHLLRVLPADVLEAFTGREIVYVSRLHGGRGFGKSWMESFGTADREEVRESLDRQGAVYEWGPGDVLHVRHVRPAVTAHPETGERLWFNNACLFHVSARGETGRMIVERMGREALPTDAFFGDGDPIDADLLDAVREISWREASFFGWRRGDVLLLDNYAAAHGRNRFAGERRVYVAME